MKLLSLASSFVALFLFSCTALDVVPTITLEGIIKVDPKTKDLSVAIKTFTNPQGTIAVTVIPMVHIAELQFYEMVNKRMTDKVVVYEYVGTTFDSFENLRSRMNMLPAPYPERAAFVFRYPYDYWAEAFDLAKQLPSVNYRLAKTAVHADIVDLMYERLRASSDRELEQAIDALASNKLKQEYQIRRPILDQDIKRAIDSHQAGITTLEDFFQSNNISISAASTLQSNLYRGTVQPRNVYIKNALKTLIHTPTPPSEIVLAYGYLHMVEIENWLQALGFRYNPTTVIWSKVLNLMRPKRNP